MKKTYAKLSDMRIGDVIKENGYKWTIDSVLLKRDWDSSIEVLSQAPRQVLSWDWVKERILECPLQIWINNIKSARSLFLYGNEKSYRINMSSEEKIWGQKEYYTEPPVPELIELVEEFAPMPVIDWLKAPKDATHHAIDKGGKGYWYSEEPKINIFAEYWFGDVYERNFDIEIGNYLNWENSLQQRPHVDDETIRFWIVKYKSGTISRLNYACTKRHLLQTQKHLVEYAPAEEVPKDGWRKV